MDRNDAPAWSAAPAYQRRPAYHRLPPPPPPPRPPPPRPPPPPPPLLFGRASLTVIVRPSISAPLRASIAARASLSLLIETKANPRGRPVSRSVITATSST